MSDNLSSNSLLTDTDLRELVRAYARKPLAVFSDQVFTCLQELVTARGVIADLNAVNLELGRANAEEVSRLTGCLATANANHEKFEREWYLRGDQIEILQARLQLETAALEQVCNDLDSARSVERLQSELTEVRRDLASTESARVAILAENAHYKQRVAELTEALQQREDQLRIALDSARTADEPSAALQSVQAMFRAAVSSLAEISQALDIPDHVASVANGNAEILKAIAHLKRASQPPPDADCICKGNWRAIVKEVERLIGREFRNRAGNTYRFFGVVHGEDDYYYGMADKDSVRLLSCVGSIEGHGYTAVTKEPPRAIPDDRWIKHSDETSATPTVWTKTPQSDPYCIHCGKTWDMHLADGRSSCPRRRSQSEEASQ